ncbi:HXXEE domain-containing protein [Paenibacillus farraposensis]|uniref:HXXEE domain-containing protein n=2 Tax=Paenibacillus farraposensis TaxID=2807095 RepID=A0ABW4DHZ7_9BACL
MMIIDDSIITMNSLMWLFLAAFMIHDFEEIIFVESWMKKNYQRIHKLVPSSLGNMIRNMSDIKSSQFAIAVFIEFIVFIPVTYLAAEHNSYILFVGVNSLLFIHVFTHLGQSIYLKSYTPGVITGLIVVLPYSLYLFYRMLNEELVSMKDILLYAPSGLILIPLVMFGHKLGKIVIRE